MQHPVATDVDIKYFTAPTRQALSERPGAEQRQARYHRALRQSGRVDVILGYHQTKTKSGVLIPHHPGNSACRCSGRPVHVEVIEEKQTDVNIALAMYADAASGEREQQVLCSNDADLEPVLARIRADFPPIRLGLTLPRRKQEARHAKSLERHAHWTRHYLRDDELNAAQFPNEFRDRRGRPIRKPETW